MAYNTNVVLENTADGYVAEGKSIKGGYFVIDALANIPSVLNVRGAKCYNQADNKVYVYNGSSWVEDTTSGGMSNPMTAAGDIIVGGASGSPTRLAKGTNGQVVKMVNGAPAWADESGGGGGGATAHIYKHVIQMVSNSTAGLVIYSTDPTPITSASQLTIGLGITFSADWINVFYRDYGGYLQSVAKMNFQGGNKQVFIINPGYQDEYHPGYQLINFATITGYMSTYVDTVTQIS